MQIEVGYFKDSGYYVARSSFGWQSMDCLDEDAAKDAAWDKFGGLIVGWKDTGRK